MSAQDDEIAALRARYARRAGSEQRYHALNPDVWQRRQEWERAVIQVLRRLGWSDLAHRRVLEVGCGTGENLLTLLRLGFEPRHLTGLELLHERHERARALLPDAVTLTLGDAAAADVADASQDLVLQSTVFSSILSDEAQLRLACAMWRWVRPGGGVLWYDFVIDNPRNPDVRGIGVGRLPALFPQGRISAKRVTLAPPLARALGRVHPGLIATFNMLPILRTHVMAWIEKPR